ncbi:MAG: hypothetical protein AAFV69_15545, partial [Pseudomonadota bacterium]
KHYVALIASAVSLMLTSTLTYAQGSTTRIEPRPYGGAIVTIEHGVRVFRPLPPTNRVIINPDGATDLTLGFSESRVIQRGGNINVQQNVRGGYGYYGGGYGGRCIPAVGNRC